MEIETTLDDVACIVRVTHYQPELAPILDGPMDRADPGSPEEFECEIVRFIKHRLSDAQKEAIKAQYLENLEADLVESHLATYLD